MTRLYYTDPIKALWMAKEFGVRFFFRYEIGDTLAIRGEDNFLARIKNPDGERFYVAKESESIFEPQNGDVGIKQESQDSFVRVGKHWTPKYVGLKDKYINIIMRDNKQFFQPLTENEND
ncbi:MAG: hypothetical protein ACJAW3_001333 [Lentimonas sp.]|jgi:hypothetical protein